MSRLSLIRNRACLAFAGVLTLLGGVSTSTASFVVPDAVWVAAPATQLEAVDPAEHWIRPEAGFAFEVDHALLDVMLNNAPLQASVAVELDVPDVISLPMPGGTFAEFEFVESSLLHPDLAAKYPEIQTFVGRGITDPAASVRFDRTPRGLHAQILSPNGAVYIDPLNRNDDIAHVSYFKRDYQRDDRHVHTCHVMPGPAQQATFGADDDDAYAALVTGESLRTYRLAVSATGEYTQFHGGTVPSALAAIVTTMNRVTGIYERELAISFQLIANNDLLIATSPSGDGLSNNDGFALLGQNQSRVDSIIGSANYDVGHIFSTGGGGIASLGVVCVNGSKARGVTGLPAPIGDPFDVDFVAHEIGHQYAGNHTFNGVNSSCAGGNRNGSTAYEPGSGTTIMAYAGICGADNLQPNSDPFFHHESFREIRNFVQFSSGSVCPVVTSTGNNDPVVDAGPNVVIPANTPFELTPTSFSDPEDDPLTFQWEQRNLGPAQALSSGDNGSSPLFRSFSPTVDTTRVFPRLPNLLNNVPSLGERLPTTNRSLLFRCIVRDNRLGGGGVGFDDRTVTVTTSAGPFRVLFPNASTDSIGGTAVINWDVANTNLSPVLTQNVDIFLSTNGGNTFDLLLADDVPNTGSATVSIPAISSTQGRIKIKASNSVYFDVSDANFEVDGFVALNLLLPAGAPSNLLPGVPTEVELAVTSAVETLDPATVQLFYRAGPGVGFEEFPVEEVAPGVQRAVLPRALCNDEPQFYFSATSTTGTTVFNPPAGPAAPYEATVLIAEVAFEDNFQSDLGWATSTLSGPSDGFWERGVPVDNDRGDPPADGDGSGLCYLTANDPNDSNSDVDGGSVILTSPLFDLSDGGTIRYQYWLNDVPNGPLGAGDGLFVEIATNASSTNWQSIRSYTSASPAWRSDAIEVGVEVASSSTLRIRFIATDAGGGDVVEAGVDAFEVVAESCPTLGDADFDADFDNDLIDFASLQVCAGLGLPPVCRDGDLDGNESIDEVDFDIFAFILSGPDALGAMPFEREQTQVQGFSQPVQAQP